MEITKITATERDLLFTLKDVCPQRLKIKVYAPSLRESTLYGEFDIGVDETAVEIALPRFINGKDGLYLRYEATIPSVQYVEGMEFVRKYEYEYPIVDTKKGLQVAMIPDAIELGVKHAALNVCIGDWVRKTGNDTTFVFLFNGKEFYFDKKMVEAQDKRIRDLSSHGIIISLILLCSKHWTADTQENMLETVLHPDYDPEGTLSAFNVMTTKGIEWYQAFIAFLCERYTRPDEKYGRAVGLIISNEVNSQWIWGNAGKKTVDEFAKEYTTALRTAWQVSTAIYKNMRVYVSLDHFWNGGMDVNQPEKYYGSHQLLSAINQYAKTEGDFYWNIAHHPYPEDLNYPDFWNDKTATDTMDTRRITFKNLKVLAQFLYQEENLYHGVRRRVILSEQGFNSHWTPESEILQAVAYGRAYRAVMEIPEIDSFILHAHCDNQFEFGLNLGLWRRKPDSQEMDAPKPIYAVFKAIDKKDETGKYHWERY